MMKRKTATKNKNINTNLTMAKKQSEEKTKESMVTKVSKCCVVVDDNGSHVKGVKSAPSKERQRYVEYVVTQLRFEFEEDEIGLLPGNVTAEQLGFDPVHSDQDTVTSCTHC